MLDEEDTYRKEKRKGRLTYPAVVRSQMKNYEKEMILKLPNELRGALKGYNHRSESDSDHHIDENNYGYF